jgi:hypothetical protein
MNDASASAWTMLGSSPDAPNKSWYVLVMPAVVVDR